MSIATITAVGELLLRGWRAIRGDKQEQDQQQAGYRTQVAANYAAEFAPRANRTWWDSLVDGLNRLPRPALVTLVLGYFITAWRSPETFAAINAGLATVPEPMWWVLGSVIGFYFAAREFHHRRRSGEFRAAAKAARELDAIRREAEQAPDRQEPPAPAAGVATDDADAHQAAPSEPTNPSIRAWRARGGVVDPIPEEWLGG